MPDFDGGVNSSWLSDLADYLQTQSIGTLATSLFIGNFEPDFREATLIVPTGGIVDNRKARQSPSFQITVRSASYLTAFNKAYSIFNLLNKKGNVTQGATRFLYFKALGIPLQINNDILDLKRFVLNFTVNL